MRIKGLKTVEEFNQQHPDGSAVPATMPLLSTSVEVRPTRDVEKLNKMEKAWLGVLNARGYPWIGVHSLTLKLGDDCRYTPDFVVISNGRVVAYETKGFMRDDALVKLKTAARQFPWLLIIKVERKGGQWIETEIKP